MKIDPTQKPLQINTPQAAPSKSERNEGKSEFAEVLSTSIQQKSGGSCENTQCMPSVARPDIRIQNDALSAQWQTADGMLDALDAYRNQLGNPKASLKMVEPYVEKMKELLEGSQSVLVEMPEGNPVKQILEQAMVHISKEIERFNLGYYVDR